MKKAGLFTWIFTATLFSVLPLTSLPAKAEGGCPRGLFPVGGGYCRNIVCMDDLMELYRHMDTFKETGPILKKYNLNCGFANDMGGLWGNMMVPMR